jgi:hypothetical protein
MKIAFTMKSTSMATNFPTLGAKEGETLWWSKKKWMRTNTHLENNLLQIEDKMKFYDWMEIQVGWNICTTPNWQPPCS